MAFACVGKLTKPEQREFILRKAFLAAAISQPELAAQHLVEAAAFDWSSDPGFFPLLAVVRGAPEDAARKVMVAAARRNPSLVLREPSATAGLSFGKAVFEAAVRSAPDEAVTLATRNPALLDALRQRPEFRRLAELASDTTLGDTERERIAIAGRGATADANFFPAVARLRVHASADDAAMLDRVLERTSQMLFRWFEDRNPALARLNAGELYLLLAYGRSEEDDLLFNRIFDGLLLPKLKAGDRLPDLHLRRFLATASEHHRLEAFLRAAGEDRLVAALRGITSLDDVLSAGEIMDAVESPRWKGLVAAELGRGKNVYYSLLRDKLAGKISGGAQVYGPPAASLQRHVFHADGDGEESFASFERQYRTDPAWKWEDLGSYVHVVGGTVEIYANKPVGEGQAEISRVLAEKGVEPSVFVHRGHSYYVEKSLRYLQPSAKLVFLGSCRGLPVPAEVMSVATDAQVIATRGVGTLSVNDPLLKAINEELRRGVAIDWNTFWRKQESRFGKSAVFEDYIPPHRNGAAQLAAAYYAWLARD